MTRTRLAVIAYLGAAVGSVAIWNANADLWLLGAGVITVASVVVGAATGSLVFMLLPVVLVPLALLFGYPEKSSAYEPFSGFAVGTSFFLFSFCAAALGIIFGGRWRRPAGSTLGQQDVRKQPQTGSRRPPPKSDG